MSRFFLLLSLWLLMPCAFADVDLAQLRADAAAGEPWAQLNLGAAYDHGMAGLTADPALAVHWYRLAAQQGVAEAQFNLAHCLATGHGVAVDLVVARGWMTQAADQGLADAQYLLGVMWLGGAGGPIDRTAAVVWLRRAADQGQAEAATILRQISGPDSADQNPHH